MEVAAVEPVQERMDNRRRLGLLLRRDGEKRREDNRGREGGRRQAGRKGEAWPGFGGRADGWVRVGEEETRQGGGREGGVVVELEVCRAGWLAAGIPFRITPPALGSNQPRGKEGDRRREREPPDQPAGVIVRFFFFPIGIG